MKFSICRASSQRNDYVVVNKTTTMNGINAMQPNSNEATETKTEHTKN